MAKTKTIEILGETFEVDDEDAALLGVDGDEVPDKPVVVQRTEWMGEERLDIRRYYWSEDRGRWRRSRTGVPIPLRDVGELLSVVVGLCPGVVDDG